MRLIFRKSVQAAAIVVGHKADGFQVATLRLQQQLLAGSIERARRRRKHNAPGQCEQYESASPFAPIFQPGHAWSPRSMDLKVN